MPKPSIDFKSVNNAALADLDNLVRLVDPDARLSGDEWLWIDPQRPSRTRGDSKVNCVTGAWADFASDDRGKDVVSWWAHCHGLGQVEAARELARRYGLEPSEATLTRKAQSKDGSPFRPVPEWAPEPNWKHLGNPQHWAYRDAEGHLMRYHLRYNRADGSKDFRPLTYRLLPDESRDWRTKGLDDPQPLYGLDRLAQRPDAPVIVVEGEKTADAAAGIFPGWVAITSGGCKSAAKADWSPVKSRDLVIWPDADEPGTDYARKVAALALAAGASSVRIVHLPTGLPEGWDLADEVPEHLDAWDLSASLADAVPDSAIKAEPVSDSARGELPSIRVKPPEYEVAAQAQEALAKLGTVFQRRGSLVHVFRSEEPAGKKGQRRIPAGSPIIKAASPGWLREQLSRSARFERAGEEGQARKSLVPDWLPRMILESSSHPGLDELVAVVETPVFVADGRILTAPGLDAETGVFLAPMGGLPAIPERPSLADARAARDRLFTVVRDFPWASNPSPETHRAAWLGLVLTAVARYAIDGPVPFGLLEANGQAAGKGLLASVIGHIVTGRDLPVATCPKDGVELQKMALPIVAEGTRIQLLDEVGAFAGSREFNGLVTATVLKGRVLGTSSTLEAAQNTLWLLAGNNVQLASDSTRRCLAVRLEPLVEHPEDRDDFTIKDLPGYVKEHQASLLADSMTILKAHHVAGSPASGLKPWGSFESWTRVIRDAVYWVTDGVDLDTRQALASTADTSRMALGQLLAALDECFNGPFTAEEALKRTTLGQDHHAGLSEALEELNRNPRGLNSRSVGHIFARSRRTVAGGLYLEQTVGRERGAALWRVLSAAALEVAPEHLRDGVA